MTTDSPAQGAMNAPMQHHLLERPQLGERQPTGPMILPADHPEIEAKPRVYPPDDARAMSPRQEHDELDAFFDRSRDSVESNTLELQAGLSALLEKIEEVKTGQEKLERDNNALQEYIGGLTKSMSKGDLSTGRKK